MNMLTALRQHSHGWLVLAALAAAMAICTWPQRLSVDAMWQMLRLARHPDEAVSGQMSEEPFDARANKAQRGGFDPFSRATGTALPVLATVTALSPAPPGPTQVVKCYVNGRLIYADNWSACPRGIGQLVSLMK